MTENQLQSAIIAECDVRANQDPRWGMVLAIPNGQYRPGQRKEPGMRAGVPDLFLPVPRPAYNGHRAYHGMFIELKVNGNEPTPLQFAWLRSLADQGYYTCWIHDEPLAAIDMLKWYLEPTL